MHEQLRAALVTRGRKPESWGAGNENAIDRMHNEIAELKRHPRLFAFALRQWYGHRAPIGMATGGFVNSRT